MMNADGGMQDVNQNNYTTLVYRQCLVANGAIRTDDRAIRGRLCMRMFQCTVVEQLARQYHERQYSQ